MRFFMCALASLPLLLAASAQAGMRCGHELVQEGESAAHLLLTCGEPLFRHAVEKTAEEDPVVELWTYNFGPGTLLQIVTLEAGRIAKIEDGERQ